MTTYVEAEVCQSTAYVKKTERVSARVNHTHKPHIVDTPFEAEASLSTAYVKKTERVSARVSHTHKTTQCGHAC